MIETIAWILWLALCYIAGYFLGIVISEWLMNQQWFRTHAMGVA